MTREAIVKIIQECDKYATNGTSREAADRILAALAKEREGEVVVLESVEVGHDGCIYIADHEYLPTNMAGKRGRLVFIPEAE